MSNNEGFAYAYGYNVHVQRLTGLWPREGEGVIHRRKGWVWIFLVIIMLWAPQAGGLAIIWGDLGSNIACLSINIPIATAIIKMMLLQWKRNVTGAILVSMSEDWTRNRSEKELEVMMKTAKISRFISILSFTVNLIAWVNHNLYQFWSAIHVEKDSTMDPRLTVGLPLDSYFPFDTTSTTVYASLWIIQSVVAYISMNSYTGTDSFASFLVLHLCGQLDVISYSLRNLVTEMTTEKPECYWRSLREIIQRHEELNQFASIVKETFSLILLVQVLVCMVTFCFQGYVLFAAVTNEKKSAKFPIEDVLLAVVYCTYMTTHLFMYCWAGNRLLYESTKVCDAFYESAWYNLAPKESKAFLLVSPRSNIALDLTAGKFCVVNLNLFGVILKKSMGYFSIILAVKDKLVDQTDK